LKLLKHKLEIMKLDETPIKIKGYCRVGTGIVEFLEDSLLFEEEGSSSVDCLRNECVCFDGEILLLNTKEQFKNLNKNTHLSSTHQTQIITYADLKTHQIIYWSSFPTLPGLITSSGVTPLVCDYIIKDVNVDGLDELYESLRVRDKGYAPGYFWYGGGEIKIIEEVVEEDLNVVGGRFGCLSTISGNNNPWSLRVLIAKMQRFKLPEEVEVVVYETVLRRLEVEGGEYLESKEEKRNSKGRGFKFNTSTWMNGKGKPGPRSVNLKNNMDQESLAEQSAQLNLKLMRWRVIPELDTSMLEKTSCLILGSGTLGCQVARNLMSWGIRKITFLDSGRVSMSNPVRQSLYTFEDSKNGGKFKAEQAAIACEEIFPGMECEGVVMSIPMPGHPISSLAKSGVEDDTSKLSELIKNHDVIYLLTDTRESRWLPSVIASSEGKILINVALGFSSWLVMRHGKGVKKEEQDESPSNIHSKSLNSDSERLGCYFCADVVAPANSMRDRTLDQQCTVTRPGLAPIASAMGVELTVALLHRKGKESGALGEIPHMIRGDLGDWKVNCIRTPGFDCCTGCSERVVKKWREEGFGLVEKVCEDEKYLEDLTGLTELKRQAEEVDWDIDDDDDDF
ncbi:hypothetical protein TL16_g11117, partial [Triparma laevis f. inornata]